MAKIQFRSIRQSIGARRIGAIVLVAGVAATTGGASPTLQSPVPSSDDSVASERVAGAVGTLDQEGDTPPDAFADPLEQAPQVGHLLGSGKSALRVTMFELTDARNATSSALGSYSWTGEYLDYADRPSIANTSNTELDSDGVITVARQGDYVYNPVTITQYGLQEWSYFRRTGDEEHLTKALRQARWLIANIDAESGTWHYDYDFAVGGFDETLEAGWSSAMAQGQAMSLLTRLHHHFPDKSAYLRTARIAHRPLVRSVEDGGLMTTFNGHQFYEEYPTRSAPSLALNGFQFTLIGLYDLAQTEFPTARELFVDGYEAMAATLPRYDADTTSAYHLGHITKAPREVHHADHYHRIHVQLLRALHPMRENDTVREFAQKWADYPPCADDPQRCGR